MHKRIFKYELHPLQKTMLVHDGCKFLSVQVQRGIPCVWVEVDTDMISIEIPIYIIPTGGQLPDANCEYLGTFQLEDGDLVFHVYTGVTK